MKLIYLHQYFITPLESGGSRSFDLARSFVAKQIEVDVITSTSNLKYKSEKRWHSISIEGITVHYIYLPYGNHFPYLKRIITFFTFLWYVSFKILLVKGDLVLATSTPLTIGIPALIKKTFHKTPFIFEVRDVWPEVVIAIGAIKNKVSQKLLYKLEQVIYHNAAAIVPLSVDMKHSIVSRYPNLNVKHVEVIENISEINRFQEGYNIKTAILKEKIGFQPRFTVLYAGTFGRVNGVMYVLKLAEKLLIIDPTIVFVLIGEGAVKNAVIQQAKEKEVLNKNVFILDSVSKQELPAWYNSVNMGSSFVIPIKELWANSANKFFDTLAASKPVLINHEGWQAKVIRADNLGYVLPDILTEESLKDFVKYTQNQKLHTLQSENAFKKAKEYYSLDIAVEKYLKVFNSIQGV